MQAGLGAVQHTKALKTKQFLWRIESKNWRIKFSTEILICNVLREIHIDHTFLLRILFVFEN